MGSGGLNDLAWSHRSRFTGWATLFTVLCCIVPPVLIGVFVFHFAVDIPFWDEFTIGETVQRFLNNGFSPGQLFGQHNEGRPAVLRLLVWVLYRPTHWDVRYLMALSFVTLCATSLALCRICFCTINHQLLGAITAILINVVLFCPSQWQCLLWGMELITFVPTFSLAVALLCLESSVRRRLVIPICGVLAWVATFTAANGLLLWFLLLPPIALHAAKHRTAVMIGWMACAAAVLIYYFHDYVRPADAGSFSDVAAHPLLALQFLLAFLGNGERIADNFSAASVSGCIAFLMWLGGTLSILTRWDDRQLFKQSLPWIMLGTYSILSAGMTTAGRFSIGPLAAIAPRYCPFAIPIWLCLFPLWMIIRRHSAVRGRFNIPGKILVIAIGLGVTGLTAGSACFVPDEIQRWHARALAARSVAQFALVSPDADAIKLVLFPDPTLAKKVISQADVAGCFHAGCALSDDISVIADTSTGGQPATGYFDAPVVIKNQIWFSGWAVLPPDGDPVDAVLLTCSDGMHVERIFSIAVLDRMPRPEAAALMHHRELAHSGWLKIIDQGRLAHGLIVSAWAYDSYHHKAFRLPGTRAVP